MRQPYTSVKTPTRFNKNPDGRVKDWSKIARNGRGRGRGGDHFASHRSPMPVQQLSVRTPVPVGTRQTGPHLMCPACRSQVTTLVRQSSASTMPWVCDVWCSPADPRREHFISSRHTNR